MTWLRINFCLLKDLSLILSKCWLANFSRRLINSLEIAWFLGNDFLKQQNSFEVFLIHFCFEMTRHEGRSWYSSHRGRMWIASTVKVPTPEEIKELEDFYRGFYGKDLVFPKSYPSGCLLGCVEVVDVLPQDQYRVEYPNGESGSPYVFVCRNPLELFVKFPMKGQHKLCKCSLVSIFGLFIQNISFSDKLDAGVHQTAKKSLQF